MRKMASNEVILAVPKKKWSRRKKIALTIYSSVVVFLIFFSVLLYFLIPNNPPYPNVPTIGTTKSSSTTKITWTVVGISGGSSILKSDVYAQVKNASGFYVIATEPLTSASGTNGFNYTSTSNGEYIALGDIFSLSKTQYAQGSQIILVAHNGWSEYCVLTV